MKVFGRNITTNDNPKAQLIEIHCRVTVDDYHKSIDSKHYNTHFKGYIKLWFSLRV